MSRHIGLDAGSVSVKLAVLDTAGNILETRYKRHKGRPLETALELLIETRNRADSLSITGSAGKLIANALGLEPINEVIAQAHATRNLYPEVRSIIEMGGEDSKLIVLEDGKLKEFSMNSVCAAGTGSFLDQQAERLGLTIEEFGELSLKSETPPRIAGRCSVFAKSDMIHLQQIATPVEDIVAGLCFAVARNFKGSICKSIKLPETVSFQGGVAANRGMIRAFREVFGLNELLIPEHFALMGAIGAALKDMEQDAIRPYTIERLKKFISDYKHEEAGHRPLCTHIEDFQKRHLVSYPIHVVNKQGRVNAYLGIDVGSISTNLAVIDEEGRLLSKRYLMTAGRPIEAVRQGLKEVGEEIGDKVEILGVGTTGSGRYMIADFVGADIVKNEITAQATAAIEIDPAVDTIFEIGGQDSKYISLRDGIIVDFEMNKACAAGTGSFLEEQAEKLDISIKGDFERLAFASDYPCSLGERCTVFMENSLLARQQRGASKKDLVAGLSYSIVQNYINRVVGDKRIGEKIFFQGGVAFNKSVVAAFENYLQKKIIVPPHHDVTGAIGMSLIAMRHMKSQGSGVRSQESEKDKRLTTHDSRLTTFKGFDLSKRPYEITSLGCKGCENLCEINQVKISGEKEALFYGSRCEKYDIRRREKTEKSDLFVERESLLEKAHNQYKDRLSRSIGIKAKIGIPRIFFFKESLPFWSTLLWELDFEVELSSKTNRQIVNKGAEAVLAESCFPVKVAHGHIMDLIEKGPDAILIPSFINLNTPGEPFKRGFSCPYVQTMPYVARVAFADAKILSPVINFELGKDFLLKQLYKTLKVFKVSMNEIKNACNKAEEAQKEFISSIKNLGREVLQTINDKTIVIIGRPYNAFDPGVNLDIPRKLMNLGILSIPMDFLPIEEININKNWPNMYWRSGQKILAAAEIIRENPNLFALYIGNFSCGPDSFIHRFFKESMGGKPFLHIEIDEHSADAGVITRCEAFLDSINSMKEIPRRHPKKARAISLTANSSNKIVYIPRMSDHAFGLAAAFESCGLDAEVMDAPDAETIKIGRRHVSGKECYPCAITTGDMVKKAQGRDFDPGRAAFFMPSGTGPCRFGQYNVLHRLVLDEIGHPDVPIFSPNQDSSFYKELGIVGKDFTKKAWMGIMAIELAIKCLHETRPYEISRGESDETYREYLIKIPRTVKSQNGAFYELLTEMRNSFARISKTKDTKPIIGIIGEIFVRHNAFSNEDIVRKVEALGCEVWLAPVEEWLYYVNLMALQKALIKKDISDIITILITRFFQNARDYRKRPFERIEKQY
ncbi:MAG: CoA protein activase [Nitrospirae bacterium]|nr:CoA protein activase [Nitrospirota bacterium]